MKNGIKVIKSFGASCEVLQIKLGSLHVGRYLLWEHLEGYYLYFKKGKGVVVDAISGEVYQQMKKFERHAAYSDKKFRENNSSLDKMLEDDKFSELACSASGGCPASDIIPRLDVDQMIELLTERDKKIIKMKISEYSNLEISRELDIPLRTVERRINSIKNKFSNY